jgi:hypothetical protein
MQNAKDTFYTMLQGRLAALNPARTIVLRGLERPGTLVEENELPTAQVPVDAFRLQWTALQVTSASPLPWVAMECSIEYATDGSPGNGGMDRGRLLAAMDAELAAALGAEPHAVAKNELRQRRLRRFCNADGHEYLLGRSGLRRGRSGGRTAAADGDRPGLRVPGSR